MKKKHLKLLLITSSLSTLFLFPKLNSAIELSQNSSDLESASTSSEVSTSVSTTEQTTENSNTSLTSTYSSSYSNDNSSVQEETEVSEQITDTSEQTSNSNEATTDQEEFFFPNERSDIVSSLQKSRAYIPLPTIIASNSNTPKKDFIDVSSHNGNITVASYNIMKQYGIKGVVVKLTEATSYRNPYAKQQILNAQAAGLKVSVYHYSWFTNQQSAISEANYFAKFVSDLNLPKDTLLINDIEEPRIADSAKHSTTSQIFEKQLKNLGYTNVMHYVGYYWITSNRFIAYEIGPKNVWVAAYPYALSKTNLYQDFGAWQWSSQLVFPNVAGYFDISTDYTGKFTSFPKIEEDISIPENSTYNVMYRLYNPRNYEHFYTASKTERDHLVATGWGQYEGVAWMAPKNGEPVYRLYNPVLRDHHYTLSKNEVEFLKTKGWRYEKIAWYSNTSKQIPVYRLFNPNLKSGSHHFTTSKHEADVLTTRDWKYEKIAWYGVSK